MVGFNWWKDNHLQLKAFPFWKDIFPSLFGSRPNYYSQKLQLPLIKQDLVKVFHSGELLDFKRVESTILQGVCKQVDKAFQRFIIGDTNGKRSGKPRFKSESSFRTLVFATANNDWVKLTRKKWFYLELPKLGIVKVRMHRALPDGFNIKQIGVTRKVDGWYMQICLEDNSVPEHKPDAIVPTWDNSMGLDAVLHEDDYLATSEGGEATQSKSFTKKPT